MKKLPDSCNDCAEYGSDFCNDCLGELFTDLPEEDREILNKVIRNLAGMINEDLGSTDTKDSEV
jgi:hypothetical protein